MPADLSYAELEIGLNKLPNDAYELQLRVSNLGSDAEIAPVRGETAIDMGALAAHQADADGYGKALTDQVFADAHIREMYGRVSAVVQASDLDLRVRVFIDPSAEALHSVRWETLRDPSQADRPLATSERILFSRFLASRDWRPLRIRPKSELSALVAVSAPTDLADYDLADVPSEAEFGRAESALAGIDRVATIGKSGDAPVTMDCLVDAMRDGVDIVYLVCHGVLHRNIPYLFLQKPESGETDRVHGGELAVRVSELAEPPRLIVLASCESAGRSASSSDDTESEPTPVLSSLATRLSDAGVPAIVAMQGKISMETVEQAMPRFFSELLKDGQIDRAMAVARGSVRSRPDSWMPTLFLRLRSGRIWYEAGFGTGEEENDVKWRGLIDEITTRKSTRGDREESCFTPVVGWDLSRCVYGSTKELARGLATSLDLPLAPYDQEHLARVAQYLLVDQRSRNSTVSSLVRQMRKSIAEKHGTLLESLGLDPEKEKVSTLISKIRAAQLGDENDPFRILAKLPASVYINAAPDHILKEALIAEGKQPQEAFASWQEEEDEKLPVDVSVERPLIYYAFGSLDPQRMDSAVLTEDDYFDYLIGISKPADRGRGNRALPGIVGRHVTNTSLLFLGLELTDLSFRVLFRLISNKDGSRAGTRPHAAVQVTPDGNLIDVDHARQYIKDYFGKGSVNKANIDIDIYWGSGEDFLTDLEGHRTQTQEVGF